MPLTTSPSPIQKALSRTFLKWDEGKEKVVSGLYKMSYRAGGLPASAETQRTRELETSSLLVCESPKGEAGALDQLANLSFLLTDGDTVSWCGIRHLLCIELLHLGKALIRSSKCLPPTIPSLSSKKSLWCSVLPKVTSCSSLLPFPFLSPQSSVPSFQDGGLTGVSPALPICHLQRPDPDPGLSAGLETAGHSSFL